MTALAVERPSWVIGFEQTRALAVRSVRNTARDPAAWVPPMVFPLLLAAIYGAQFSRATELPGFPEVDSFLQFVLPECPISVFDHEQQQVQRPGLDGNRLSVPLQLAAGLKLKSVLV